MKHFLLLTACLCMANLHGSLGRGIGEHSKGFGEEKKPEPPKKPEAPKPAEKVKEAAKPEQKPPVREQPRPTTTTTTTIEPEVPTQRAEYELSNLSKNLSTFVFSYLRASGQEFKGDKPLTTQEMQELKKHFTPENIIAELEEFNQQLQTALKAIKPELSTQELQSMFSALEELGPSVSMLAQEMQYPADIGQRIKTKMLLYDIEWRIREATEHVQDELIKRDPVLRKPLKPVAFDIQRFMEQHEGIKDALADLMPFTKSFYDLIKQMIVAQREDKLSEKENNAMQKFIAEYSILRPIYDKHLMQYIAEIEKGINLSDYLKVLIADYQKLIIAFTLNYHIPSELEEAKYALESTQYLSEKLLGINLRKLLSEEEMYTQFHKGRGNAYAILEEYWYKATQDKATAKTKAEEGIKKVIEYLQKNPEKILRDEVIDRIAMLIGEKAQEKQPSSQSIKAAEIIADILLNAMQFINIEKVIAEYNRDILKRT